MLRIGVDFHVMEGMHQGSRRYLYGLYKAFDEINHEHAMYYFMADTNRRPIDIGDESQYKSFGTNSSFKRLAYAANASANREAIDLMHYQYAGPLMRRKLEVLTIHDILFESHPQYFPCKTRLILGPMIRRSASKAAAIFTVSEFSRREIISRYNISDEKVFITPNGVDFNLFNPGLSDESANYVYKKYGIREFVLSVGRIEPRKNHIGLLRAYANLKNRRKDMPKMVFIGAKDFGTSEVLKIVQKYRLMNDIVLLNGISDMELGHFYRSALCLAYPSFAEGFGLPPIEAMACGCPVLTSGTTAIAEVVAGCGWIVDPYCQDSIESGLENVIYSNENRKKFVTTGLERVKLYDWNKSARVMLSVYNNISLDAS